MLPPYEFVQKNGTRRVNIQPSLDNYIIFSMHVEFSVEYKFGHFFIHLATKAYLRKSIIQKTSQCRPGMGEIAKSVQETDKIQYDNIRFDMKTTILRMISFKFRQQYYKKICFLKENSHNSRYQFIYKISISSHFSHTISIYIM